MRTKDNYALKLLLINNAINLKFVQHVPKEISY